MPRRRKYGGRKRKYVRRTGRNSGGLGRTIRRTIEAMAETKFRLTEFTDNNVTIVPGGFSWANGLGVGTANNQRIGSQIRVKRLTASFSFFFNPTLAGYHDCVVRVVVLYPRKGVSDADMSSYVSANFTVYNKIDPSRFIVMMDRRWTMGSSDPAVTNGSAPNWKQMKIILRKTKYVWNYNVANQVDRQPRVYFCSILPEENTSECYLSGWIQTSYKDI